MLHVMLLLLITTLNSIYGLNAERDMAAENRIYVGDFAPSPYSMGSTDNNNGYPYHNNYISFPPTNNNNGYQSYNHHSAPTTMPNYQTQTLGGYNGYTGYANYAPFNAVQGYNNFGMTRTYGGSMSSNGNYAPITYSTHRPMIGALHTSIGAAFGGGMNGIPAYLANGHYSSYYPYNSLGIIHPYK
ncbi:staphylococcal secretory antigen ssaA2-like [Zeugodacus cucurbitae]|uniref:staphylococcal secretory antigen ssaA2-like n=1 Tax=Zeugodacus cucurbitae TaxID=28588 RepID=UPI0023D9255B|nr:staphylococcal secretory antigen ssaA2-like [Zeugodacus cucurbitae]